MTECKGETVVRQRLQDLRTRLIVLAVDDDGMSTVEYAIGTSVIWRYVAECAGSWGGGQVRDVRCVGALRKI